jgi:hypothetical protein
MEVRRSEAEVFADLARLCVEPGYIHAIAFFSFRDNLIRFGEALDADAMESQHAKDRLVRTEISTLIGLMVRAPISYGCPVLETLSRHIDETQALLAELHHTMTGPWRDGIKIEDGEIKIDDPFWGAGALREPIFYAGESAYGFQYRTLAVEKYQADDDWLVANKGFTIQQAIAVAEAIASLQTDQQTERAKNFRHLPPEEQTMLPAFQFSHDAICERCDVEPDRVSSVLDAFSLPEEDRNDTFGGLNDFNVTNALPILRTCNGEYVLLQLYGLLEAIYESPFFWMMADKPYVTTAKDHRGAFTERIAAEALSSVFGTGRVYRNLDIYRPSGDRLGEIDVLVVYGNRAVVVQAKSKRLTMESRKGNDQALKRDFALAVQSAADQSFDCGEALLDPTNLLKTPDGQIVDVPRAYKTIHSLCVLCDHYPALAFQAEQFLKARTTDIIAKPLVLDLFALDVMSELLSTPLHFLHYLTLRARFGDKFSASSELTLLGYHLARNLWGDGEFDKMVLADDIATGVDIAMLVRREGLPGARTPEGILTRLKKTTFGKVLAQIEQSDALELVDLGLNLLQLGEDTARALGRGIDTLSARTRADRRPHDLSLAFPDTKSGLTVHCRYERDDEAARRLMGHCQLRKHAMKADSWFGLLIEPDDRNIMLSVGTDEQWEPNAEWDELAKPFATSPLVPWSEVASRRRYKVGRNDPCPCGSGKKHKKCCINLRRS